MFCIFIFMCFCVCVLYERVEDVFVCYVSFYSLLLFLTGWVVVIYTCMKGGTIITATYRNYISNGVFLIHKLSHESCCTKKEKSDTIIPFVSLRIVIIFDFRCDNIIPQFERDEGSSLWMRAFRSKLQPCNGIGKYAKIKTKILDAVFNRKKRYNSTAV